MFGGTHSNFTLYPRSKDVTVTFVLNLVLQISFRLLFDLISSDIIHSVKINNDNQKVESIKPFFTCVIYKAIKIYTYKIEVQKYESIQLRLNKQSTISYTIYEGPGFLCKKINVNNTERNLVLTNFQCIVQIICQEQGIYKNNITYFGQRLPWNQIELKYFNNAKAINFNSSSYFRHSDSYPILYLFHSPSNSVVKVKVTHFQGRIQDLIRGAQIMTGLNF